MTSKEQERFDSEAFSHVSWRVYEGELRVWFGIAAAAILLWRWLV